MLLSTAHKTDGHRETLKELLRDTTVQNYSFFLSLTWEFQRIFTPRPLLTETFQEPNSRRELCFISTLLARSLASSIYRAAIIRRLILTATEIWAKRTKRRCWTVTHDTYKSPARPALEPRPFTGTRLPERLFTWSAPDGCSLSLLYFMTLQSRPVISTWPHRVVSNSNYPAAADNFDTFVAI